MRIKKFMSRGWAASLLVAALALVGIAFAAPPKAKLSTPTISCVTVDEGTIAVTVCTGASGAPAGFSIQWMTSAEYLANGGWYASDDARLCKASFSGNAQGNNYVVPANTCMTVDVGAFLYDNGASTTCGDALQCGTAYVFRSFAHATSKLQRSEFSASTECSTESCGECLAALSHGGFQNNFRCMVVGVDLGNRFYTRDELLAILDLTNAGNVTPHADELTKLARQVLSVKLSNLYFGDACNADVAECLAAADALFIDNVPQPIGSGSDSTGTADTLEKCLADWITLHHVTSETANAAKAAVCITP
jgi:hypothetical protein